MVGALFSCGENHFYKTTMEILDSSWAYEDTLSYTFQIEDTTARYDIGLEISHQADYEYQNLYVKILTRFPDQKLLSQTLPIDFADNTGKWYGDCRGDRCVVHVQLQQNAIFDQIGSYRFQIAQFMRVNPVRGIESTALILDKKD